MLPVEPIFTAELFSGLHAELIALLKGLGAEDWARTATPRWTVKDVAAHLLDVDIRRLSFQRDRLPHRPPATPIEGYDGLVEYLNRLNAEWVVMAERMSPRVLVSFLEVTGPQVAQLFQTLDPFAPAHFPVGWAGETESANWFDVAREYTERWHHQQQIRDATGAPPLYARAIFHPVLDTFLRGLPHAYRGVAADDGATIVFDVTGEAGGRWTLARESSAWTLYAGDASNAAARVSLSQDTAWRLLTKGLSPDEAAPRVHIEGDRALGTPILHMLSVMA